MPEIISVLLKDSNRTSKAQHTLRMPAETSGLSVEKLLESNRLQIQDAEARDAFAKAARFVFNKRQSLPLGADLPPVHGERLPFVPPRYEYLLPRNHFGSLNPALERRLIDNGAEYIRITAGADNFKVRLEGGSKAKDFQQPSIRGFFRRTPQELEEERLIREASREYRLALAAADAAQLGERVRDAQSRGADDVKLTPNDIDDIQSRLGQKIAAAMEKEGVREVRLRRDGESASSRLEVLSSKHHYSVLRDVYGALPIRLKDGACCSIAEERNRLSLTDIEGVDVAVSELLPWISLNSLTLHRDGRIEATSSLGTVSATIPPFIFNEAKWTLSSSRSISASRAGDHVESEFLERYGDIAGELPIEQLKLLPYKTVERLNVPNDTRTKFYESVLKERHNRMVFALDPVTYAKLQQAKRREAEAETFRRVAPIHLEAALIAERFGAGAPLTRAGAEKFLNQEDLDAKVSKLTDSLLSSSAAGYFERYTQAPTLRKQALEAIRNQMSRMQGFGVHNRFARLVDANVRVENGRVQQLGFVGAFKEMIRQGRFDLASANRFATGLGMRPYTQNELDTMLAAKGPDFVNEKDKELSNPMERDYVAVRDLTDKDVPSARLARQSIEAARATGANLTGFAEYVSVYGSTSALVPGGGLLSTTKTVELAKVAGFSGYNLNLTANRLTEAYLEKVALHYHVQRGQSTESPEEIDRQWQSMAREAKEEVTGYLGRIPSVTP